MDVYKISVEIALAGTIVQGLETIAAKLTGIHTKVGQIEGGMKRWALGLGGVASVMAGTGIIKGMADIVKHGEDIVHQQELLKIAGASNLEIAKATAMAYKTSADVLSTSLAGNLEHLRELKYAFGSMDVASANYEQVAKANAVLNSVKGGGNDQVWEFVKSLEGKGETINPKEFQQYIDVMTQAVEASGGRVTPQGFFSAFKYGRTAALGWDKDFVGDYLPRLIQSLASSRTGGGGSGTGGPGNALMSAFAKVIQGQMTAGAAQQFDKLGLAPGGIQKVKGSSTYLFPGGVKGDDDFIKNPYEWVQSTLIPALKAHGFDTADGMMKEIPKLFQNRTASQIITEMALQGRAMKGDQSPFEKDKTLNREAMAASNAQKELAANDPQQIMKSFTTQWNNLLSALGAPLVSQAMEGIKSITSALTWLTNAAGAHPERVKLIGDAIVGLAGALIVLGGLGIAAAAAMLIPGGAIAAAVVGIGSVIAALAAFNWDTVKGFFSSLSHIFIDALSKLPGELLGAINSAIAAIASEFISAIGSLPGKIMGAIHGLLGAPTSMGVNPDGTMRATPNSFVAPRSSGPRLQQINTHIQVDGRTIARAISYHQARDAEFSTGAPAADGLSIYTGPDHNYSSI